MMSDTTRTFATDEKKFRKEKRSILPQLFGSMIQPGFFLAAQAERERLRLEMTTESPMASQRGSIPRRNSREF